MPNGAELEEKTFEVKEKQQVALSLQLEEEFAVLIRMTDNISSEKVAAIISLCQHNHSLFLEMMHQQNLLLLERLD